MFKKFKLRLAKAYKALTIAHSHNPHKRPIDPTTIIAVIPVEDAIKAIRREGSTNSELTIAPEVKLSMHGRKRMRYKVAHQQDGHIKCVDCGCIANACVVTPCKEALFGYVGTFAHIDPQGQAFRFTVDHIIPKWTGGTLHNQNCQIMCEGCNQKVGSKLSLINRLRFVFKALFA